MERTYFLIASFVIFTVILIIYSVLFIYHSLKNRSTASVTNVLFTLTTISIVIDLILKINCLTSVYCEVYKTLFVASVLRHAVIGLLQLIILFTGAKMALNGSFSLTLIMFSVTCLFSTYLLCFSINIYYAELMVACVVLSFFLATAVQGLSNPYFSGRIVTQNYAILLLLQCFIELFRIYCVEVPNLEFIYFFSAVIDFILVSRMIIKQEQEDMFDSNIIYNLLYCFSDGGSFQDLSSSLSQSQSYQIPTDFYLFTQQNFFRKLFHSVFLYYESLVNQREREVTFSLTRDDSASLGLQEGNIAVTSIIEGDQGNKLKELLEITDEQLMKSFCSLKNDKLFQNYAKNYIFAKKCFEFQTFDTNFIFEIIEEREFNFNQFKLMALHDHLEQSISNGSHSFLPMTVDILQVTIDSYRLFVVINKHFYSFASFSNLNNWFLIEQSLFKNKIARSSGLFSFVDVNQYFRFSKKDFECIRRVLERDIQFLSRIEQESEVKFSLFLADNTESFIINEENLSLDQKKEALKEFIQIVDEFETESVEEIETNCEFEKIYFLDLQQFRFMVKMQLSNVYRQGNWTPTFYEKFVFKVLKDFKLPEEDKGK